MFYNKTEKIKYLLRSNYEKKVLKLQFAKQSLDSAGTVHTEFREKVYMKLK